jgi:hypothetical protein
MSEDGNKKRQRHFDRVTLDADTLVRLDSWIGQVEAVKAGVLLSRKDVLNWLVMKLPDKLSAAQEKGLADEFYSELRYLQFAEREIRAAETRGERLTLKDLEERRVQGQIVPKRKARKSKACDDAALDAQESSPSNEADSGDALNYK